MLSQIHSFEYNAAQLTNAGLKVDAMLILLCLAGLLLFISGLIVGQTMTSLTNEAMVFDAPAHYVSPVTHGRYGIPRWERRTPGLLAAKAISGNN